MSHSKWRAPGLIPGKKTVDSPPATTKNDIMKKTPRPAPLPIPSPPPLVPLAPLAPPPTVTFAVPDGQEGMARHLIPRGISVVGMRFQQDVVAPGTTFGFDVHGTGFDDTFYRMISIDADTIDIQIANLQLVTANQIHGQMSVGEAALTAWVKPLIYIRGQPVFKAPEPFGVVRRGEVLDIQMTSIDETGQHGQFRLITNVSYEGWNRLKIVPSTPKLEVGNIKTRLPFYVDGTVQIGEMVSAGSYGLSVMQGSRDIFKKIPLVEVVKPTLGKTGSIEDVVAVSPAVRPLDRVSLVIRGSGFTARDAATLQLDVPTLQVVESTVAYVSPGHLNALVHIPASAVPAIYGMRIQSSGKLLFEKKTAFVVVPPNWLSSAKLASPLKPGGASSVNVTGRDLSSTYAATLRLEVDEPGLRVAPLRWLDATRLAADIHAASHVAAGDYLIHVYSGDKEVKLPGGNLIRVTP